MRVETFQFIVEKVIGQSVFNVEVGFGYIAVDLAYTIVYNTVDCKWTIFTGSKSYSGASLTKAYQNLVNAPLV